MQRMYNPIQVTMLDTFKVLILCKVKYIIIIVIIIFAALAVGAVIWGIIVAEESQSICFVQASKGVQRREPISISSVACIMKCYLYQCKTKIV